MSNLFGPLHILDTILSSSPLDREFKRHVRDTGKRSGVAFIRGVAATGHAGSLTTTQEAGDSIPDWVEALRAPSGDLPVAAYNFAFGGSGQGWGGDDGLNPTILTVEQALEAGVYVWDSATIIDGLGLTTATSAHPSFVEEIIPASLLTNGATLFLQTVPNTPDGDHRGFAYYMWENPGFGFWGAINHLWSNDQIGKPDEAQYQDNSFSTVNDVPDPTPTVMRSVLNVYSDADRKGSTNGGAVVNVPNVAATSTPNYITLEADGNSNIAYAQIMAIYALQPDDDLPAMSAVPTSEEESVYYGGIGGSAIGAEPIG